MKALREREKSSLLKGMEALHGRLAFLPKEEQYLTSLRAGLVGELFFDKEMKRYITNDAAYISDLLLNINGKSTQIDAILLTTSCVYVFEIKNFYGEYKYNGSEFKRLDGYVILNPVEQLNRSLAILSQLFKQWDVSIPIVGKVVFVNKAFTLYTNEPNDTVLLPTQLESFFIQLNNQVKPMMGSVRILANKLVAINQEHVPFQKQLPDYEYSQLRKGLNCVECKRFELEITQRSSKCLACGKQSTIRVCLLHSIDEYRLLFPKNKLTTTGLFEWMGGTITKEKIRNTLKTHYKRFGKSRATYFE